MNGHVKSMQFQLLMKAAAKLFCLWLVMAVGATRGVMASREQACDCLSRALKITQLVHRESEELIKTYEMSQGFMPEFFCKVPQSNIPNPNISGLEQSERMASISTRLRAFFPHFRRVYEQQSDLQPPTNTLLGDLNAVSERSRSLAGVVGYLYQLLYPNQLEPAPPGGPTKPPPPQNVFQQKIYGCVVLKTYNKFLSNVMTELKTLKSTCTHKGWRREAFLRTTLRLFAPVD